MIISQKPKPIRIICDSGQKTCHVPIVVNDTIPSKNKAPKNAASPTLPTSHQPLMRWPRFFPHRRTNLVTKVPAHAQHSIRTCISDHGSNISTAHCQGTLSVVES